MVDHKTLDDLVDRIAAWLPQAGALGAQKARKVGEEMNEELRAGLRQLLEQAFTRLNVLTREDFEAQLRALERAEHRIAVLEQQVRELEAHLQPRQD